MAKPEDLSAKFSEWIANKEGFKRNYPLISLIFADKKNNFLIRANQRNQRKTSYCFDFSLFAVHWWKFADKSLFLSPQKKLLKYSGKMA